MGEGPGNRDEEEASMNTESKVGTPGTAGTAPRECWLALWAMFAAFGCYFCMYAFRKPFTAGDYSDTWIGRMDFKTILVTAQVAGYMISKFIGIKVIAEMPPERRAWGILWLVLLAEGALVLFGMIPRPWNALCLFLNGLPLGMVFGLVLGTLEGRRATEAMTAGLCASFILADGATKSVGAWLLQRGVAEDWMPSVAGALFLVPLAGFVAMLRRVPPPSEQDEAQRAPRFVMTREDRWALIRRYAVGLVPLVALYLIVTILRSVRADFAPELWRGLGSAAQPATFTLSEMCVAFGVLVVNGSVVLIANNRTAFFTALATCGVGVGMLGVALLARQAGWLDGFSFMVAVGLGLYLPYVAMHTTVFERLLAMTRERGNLGFLMYVADAIGYLGYVVVMVIRNFTTTSGDLVPFFLQLCGWAVVVTMLCLAIGWKFFAGVRVASPTLEAVRGVA